MHLRCRKCGKMFDPECESAFCSSYGHTPLKVSGQKLTDALLQQKPKKEKRPEFQSDFKLIWNEPGA